MYIYQETISIATSGQGFLDITEKVSAAVARSGMDTGLCTIFITHTSASLVIQENADPAVLRDLSRWMSSVAPESFDWEHDAEGIDDMPAHARTALTHTSESIPISKGGLCLGTWQALYLWEHRAKGHQRQMVIHIAGIQSAPFLPRPGRRAGG